MLITYTPDQHNADTEAFYTSKLPLNLTSSSKIYRTNNGLALKTCWCREVVTGKLTALFGQAPEGTVNIYGIRKHGTSARYQPVGCPGRIGRTTRYTDNLFTDFFQMMVELLACILDDKDMPLVRVRGWINRFNNISFNDDYEIAGPDPTLGMRCILNVDEESIPDLSMDGFWKENNTFGTILNIPAHWAACMPIMSYLLYIPRLWGAFYSTPRMLQKLSQMTRPKYPLPAELNCVLGSSTSRTRSAKLWLGVAKHMMIPLWLTPYGKEDFWTFTFFLMVCALNKHRVENPKKLLTETASLGSGFQTWCRWYRMKEDHQIWFRGLYKELLNHGYFRLLCTRNIVGYL